MLFRPLPTFSFPCAAGRPTAHCYATYIFLASSCRLQVIPNQVLDASVDVHLCALLSPGVLREKLWCLVCSSLTDQFATWHKL